MTQLSIDFARAEGEAAAERCARAAESRGWDRAGAENYVLGYLRRWGPTPGETLTAEAKAHGFRPPAGKDRAFGHVFLSLSRRKLIRCLRSDLPRAFGHGTSGGKLWEAVQ